MRTESKAGENGFLAVSRSLLRHGGQEVLRGRLCDWIGEQVGVGVGILRREKDLGRKQLIVNFLFGERQGQEMRKVVEISEEAAISISAAAALPSLISAVIYIQVFVLQTHWTDWRLMMVERQWEQLDIPYLIKLFGFTSQLTVISTIPKQLFPSKPNNQADTSNAALLLCLF